MHHLGDVLAIHVDGWNLELPIFFRQRLHVQLPLFSLYITWYGLDNVRIEIARVVGASAANDSVCDTAIAKESSESATNLNLSRVAFI
jgi:hypothetical protein